MTKPRQTAAAKQMADQMATYQKMMDDSIAKYEALVASSQAKLNSIINSATEVPEQSIPEAEWTESNGNQLLILNQPAAEFFVAIFKQVGVLADQLGEMAKKK